MLVRQRPSCIGIKLISSATAIKNKIAYKRQTHTSTRKDMDKLDTPIKGGKANAAFRPNLFEGDDILDTVRSMSHDVSQLMDELEGKPTERKMIEDVDPDDQKATKRDDDDKADGQPEEEKKELAPPAPEKVQKAMKWGEVFKYSSKKERFIAKFGLFCSFCNGASTVMYALVIGSIIKIFDPRTPMEKKDELFNEVAILSL